MLNIVQAVTHRRSPSIAVSLSVAVVGTLVLRIAGFAVQGHIGFSWADEGLLWYDSQRTALGQLPLRDFYGYDPGRYYWVAIFFRVFHASGLHELLIANAAFGAFGMAALWFAMSRANLPVLWQLVIALLIEMALGFPRHKVYEQALSLVALALAFAVLVKPSSALRWLLFGIAAGLAAFIGRNAGVYYLGTATLCVAVLASRRELHGVLRLVLCYIVGVFIGYAPMLILLSLMPGLLDAFIRSLLFLPNWQLPLPIPFPWRIRIAGMARVDQVQVIATSVACLSVPLLYLAGILWAIWSARTQRVWSKPAALWTAGGCAGLPWLYQAFDRADFGHIANGMLPAFAAAGAAATAWWLTARWKGIAVVASAAFVFIMAACWLPFEPYVQFARIRASNPSAIVTTDVDGYPFEMFGNQVQTLLAVKRAYLACKAAPDGFLAAPHFPGVYAYLHAKAPFWEMYYLYPRPPAFQRQHIAAIAGHTRVILLAPDATVDGLERLKLRNTYGLLMNYIDRNFVRLPIPLPDGYRLEAEPGACTF